MKILFSCLVSVLLFCGCESPEKKTSSAPILPVKNRVAVSLPPYAYFVHRIAADTVTVTPIVPVQSNPHLFEPTPKQVEEVLGATLWIRSHEAFENKILTVLSEQNPHLAIIDLAKNLPDEEEDRHIWLSPKLAQNQAQAIAAALIELLPAHRDLYQQNLKNFIEDLENLDAEITNQLTPFKDRAILTSHPAFGFFCHDYGLMQLSIECEGKDPLPQDLEKTLTEAKAQKVTHILLQPQHNNRGAEMVAHHLNLPVFTIDPYSSDYIENLRQIAKLITNDPLNP